MCQAAGGRGASTHARELVVAGLAGRRVAPGRARRDHLERRLALVHAAILDLVDRHDLGRPLADETAATAPDLAALRRAVEDLVGAVLRLARAAARPAGRVAIAPEDDEEAETA